MNQASFFEQCVKKMQNSITSDPSNGSKSLWPRFLLKIYSIREVIIYLSHSGQFNLTPTMKKHHRDLVAMRTLGLSDFPGNCFLLPLSESIFYFLKVRNQCYKLWQMTENNKSRSFGTKSWVSTRQKNVSIHSPGPKDSSPWTHILAGGWF